MLAIGCLVPIFLFAVGALAGFHFWGPTGGMWLGGGGLAIGAVALAGLAWLMERLKS